MDDENALASFWSWGDWPTPDYDDPENFFAPRDLIENELLEDEDGSN